jgi:hypothetical protein
MAIVPPVGAEQPWYVILYGAGGPVAHPIAPNFQFMQTSTAGAQAQVTKYQNQGLASSFEGPFTSLNAARAAVGLPPQGSTAPTGTPVTVPTGKPTGGKTPAPAPTAKPVDTIIQPKFDKRMRTVRNPLNGGQAQFDRGFMVWDTAFTQAAGYDPKNPPAVSFLFNPSTVQASYSLSDSTAQAAMIFGVAGGGTPFVGLQQQMNFTIMFDRTYEVQWPVTAAPATPWSAGGDTVAEYAGQDVIEMGCEVDVRQMKQFTGMFSNANTGSGAGFYTTGANATNPTAGATALGSQGSITQTINQATGSGAGPQQGIMLIMPSFCYFGSSIVGGTSQFYGYVDSWDVQYTHYTNLMVPIRCVVDVEYTLLPQASDNLAEFTNAAVKILADNQNQGASFS